MFKSIIENIGYLSLLVGILFFGSIAHATAQLQISRTKKEPFTIIDFLILMPLCMFSGLIFGLISYMFFEENHVFVILSTAIGSFLGIAGLNKVANSFLELIIIKLNNRKR